ncbi:histidine phosphatase family protein [Lysinibacter cavernae]|uniref:Putative phosphoglycerate mutase n=1 Tax=Lysinibacter cavernae TaxID=1640652 RepID=A0A7X5R0Z8_9MICO|nr:putative phosphoglycerate mutase [Lysinibacter cavernae]
MTETTTIALIRHGQTPWNAEFRIQGRTDIDLNDTGREQARFAAKELDDSWNIVTSSPLSRASETAAIIAEGLGLSGPAHVDHLVERNFGRAEGLTAGDELEAVRLPGGFVDSETEAEVSARGLLALEHLRDTYAGKNVIAVSHGSFIRLTLQGLFDLTMPRINNAAVSIVTFTPDGWSLDTVNGVPAHELV